MNIFVYGSQDVPIIKECAELIKKTEGFDICNVLEEADIAIAPLLQKIIREHEINTPKFGTLIFHPSLLPRHRGSDAIKWTYRMGEKYTGVTWFWADEGIDTGPICEMEVLSIKEGEKPGEFYFRAVIPAAVRLLQFILSDLKAGIIRKRPQIEENATYEKPIKKAVLT